MAAPENNPLVKNWLVKSSTKILGPFTREEVLELLTHRQITIIDEIRQPEGRWNYIRENRHFKEIVKNLRYEDDHNREDTMTSTMTSTATIGSQTITKSESGYPLEFNSAPVVPTKAPPPSAAATGGDIKDVTPLPQSEPRVAKIPTAAKSFGNLQDQRVQSKIQKQNVFLRTVLFVIVLGAAVFLGYNYLRKEKRSDLGYGQLLASALRYKELGLYDRSLDNYKKAAAIKEPDLDSQFQMAFLLINQDRQSLNGRRIIERASLKEGRSRHDIIQAHLGIALSYMMEGDFSQADSHFQKALSFDGNNPSAKLNQATILFKKGNYAQALEGYEALSQPSSVIYPLVLLYKSMATIELAKVAPSKTASADPAAAASTETPMPQFKPHGDIEREKKLIQEITPFIAKSHFLRKELALMLAYLAEITKDTAAKETAFKSFMEEPYNFSALFVKDPSLDWRNAEWDYLEKYCADVFHLNASEPASKSVRAICLLESNRDMEAMKLIDEALAADPKQASSLQAQALYLWKLGRTNEAKLLLQTADLKENRLSLYIVGEACTTAKDYTCANGAYQKLEQKDANDVVPPYGMARIKSEQKDKAQALTFVKTGLERERNFIPLIELREKLESL